MLTLLSAPAQANGVATAPANPSTTAQAGSPPIAPSPKDTPACRLVLSAHRSGQALAALPLPQGDTGFQIAFVHSVLGTPVVDDYRFRPGPDGRWQAHLEAERFEGEGYGLPYAADPDPARGEHMARDGDGWRLTLDRLVDPLVVLPLPTQRMRLLLPGSPPLLLGSLSPRSVLFTLSDCPHPAARPVLQPTAQP